MAGQTSNVDQFEAYFQRADLDRDGRISGSEAVAFLQASNLPRPVLAQIWTYADQNRTGFLGRAEFCNALKLVTVAQRKRELTPEIVKAALYSPASAKIPAPQINLAATQGPRSNVMTSASPTPTNQGFGAIRPHGVIDQPTHVTRPPRPPLPNSGLQSHVGSFQVQGTGTGGSSAAAFGSINGSQVGISSGKNNPPSAAQGGLASVAPQSSQQKMSVSSTSASLMSNSPALMNSHVGMENARSPSAAGNGYTSDSVFGDAFSVAPQPKQHSASILHSDRRPPTPHAGNLTSSKDQLDIKQSSVAVPAQGRPVQAMGKVNQNVLPQAASAIPAAAGNLASSQPQPPWPRITQSDIQKYSRVFMQVDTDRDGKITGEQARNLFLSWKLPREVLKQVWELSDQDNDGMISLREFCIALYLMEQYREGRPLPRVLPNFLMFDETLPPASGQPGVPYGNTTWRPSPGFQQPQATRMVRPVTSSEGGKPPRPAAVPVPQPDEPIQHKPKVPELEKHLVDQLSTEEQESLNKKFQDAKDAEKKVADLEKEILESRQKVQFYHAKMQELVLYKSRCDSRLNEISEKVVGDKREAEALAKKYEEKYHQVGDVASKLSIEEATFRDIQAKKMELYRAILKLEQETGDDVKDRASKIQSDLEELVKSLNEQCKTYGLRAKPTTLVELPFGWQPGVEGTAADWDENWDKFDDEGFTYVKEQTLDIENVLAPPKPKTPLIREKVAEVDDGVAKKSPPKADERPELPGSDEIIHENEKLNAHDREPTSKSPPYSPAASSEPNSPFKDLPHLRMPREATFDGSPHAFDSTSEFGGAESTRSGGRDFDEPPWGPFDTRFDSDSAWDHNPDTPKGGEYDINGTDSLFGADEWGLNPIKTGSTGKTTNQSPFFDSVPSTPLYSSANSPQKRQSVFFDSVPSTPAYGISDNMFTRNSTSAFADSVPSTPMYNYSNSPRKYSEGSEEQQQYSFENSFSRFDSFNVNDSGPFGSSLSRFDSTRSTRDSEFDQGSLAPPRDSFARFDSFRSTADSDYNFGLFPPQESKLSRFDSMSSSDYGHHGFASFDDADPFGSSEPFRSSTPKTQTRENDTDSWRAF